MDPLVILSPHLDDAVLSCGQLLADRPECVVVTVFAGPPHKAAQVQTSYDKTCGFRNAAEAIEKRRAEDEAALASFGLDHRVLHLEWVDHGYADGAMLDYHAAAHQVSAIVGGLRTVQQVVGPMGLAHPDHLATAEVFHRVLDAHPEVEGWMYEDLPSRVLYPDEIPDRHRWWRFHGFDPVLASGTLGLGPLSAKREAVGHYQSQLAALGEQGLAAVSCPERMWRLWRAS